MLTPNHPKCLLQLGILFASASLTKVKLPALQTSLTMNFLQSTYLFSSFLRLFFFHENETAVISRKEKFENWYPHKSVKSQETNFPGYVISAESGMMTYLFGRFVGCTQEDPLFCCRHLCARFWVTLLLLMCTDTHTHTNTRTRTDRNSLTFNWMEPFQQNDHTSMATAAK